MSCSLWPSTRKYDMHCPLHHGCSHTWENISQQIPRCHTLSFLERNLRLVPQNLRERAYLVTMRPALEYAPTITDPQLSCDIKCLDSIHWHAACFVTNNPWIRYDPEQDQVSVTALLKDLGWDDRATRREESRCTLMYKILNDQVAIKEDFRPPFYKGNLSSAAHQVQIYCPWTILLPPHRQGLEPPSPGSKGCSLTWGVQGGTPPVTIHQRLYLSCTCF